MILTGENRSTTRRKSCPSATVSTTNLCGQNVEFVNVKHGGTYSYMYIQSVPRSIHTPSQLYKPVS
jgi:hypothetical protein